MAGRKDEAQRATECVGQPVNLGRQFASGTPQRLVARLPFPVAACRRARTIVLSIIRY